MPALAMKTQPKSAEVNEVAGAESGLAPLRSVHTETFLELLAVLQSSLLLSTYQAGKLVMVRPGTSALNTHFRPFAKPMGLALDRNRLAIGGAVDIWEFHNVPAAAKEDDEKRLPDCCFLPRRSHTTGDIQIHEMAWGRPIAQDVSPPPTDGLENDQAAAGRADELWFVNTRFSCLCTRSDEHSFVPQWRPEFISSLTPEDRCHLNGLAMVDGHPKYVTALGESDAADGWRESKAQGGVLIDVSTNEVIARGLSMPHSPRFYRDRLWVLNSGEGGMGYVDLDSGKYIEVLQLPGFTRGLSFMGRYAFVGLSQVRESAVFSGIKIADRPVEERWSGVAAVDIETGQCVAWLRFEDAVQEVFAVNVMPGLVRPDIVNDDAELMSTSYVLPDEALQDVPSDWRDGARREGEAMQ